MKTEHATQALLGLVVGMLGWFLSQLYDQQSDSSTATTELVVEVRELRERQGESEEQWQRALDRRCDEVRDSLRRHMSRNREEHRRLEDEIDKLRNMVIELGKDRVNGP